MRRRAPYRAGLHLGKWNELDRLAKAVVMVRAGAENMGTEERPKWRGSCERCRLFDWMNWCHVISRACIGTRWDPDNAYAWCDGCHRTLDQHWQRKLNWVLERIGEERWSALLVRSQAGRRPDYEALKLFLQRERKAIEADRGATA